MFAVALLALTTAVAPARSLAETVLVDTSQLVQATQTFVFPLEVTAAGLLDVSLSDLAWTDKLSSLTLVLADSKGILHRHVGEGSFTFELGGATHLFAHVTGIASANPLRLGLIGLQIRFHPAAPAVPLPAAAWLLLGGLGALGVARALGRSRAS
jgi:hypothetical protein